MFLNNSQCNIKVIDKSIRYNKYCLIIHSLNYFEYNTFFLGIKNIKLKILNEIMRQGIHICITFTQLSEPKFNQISPFDENLHTKVFMLLQSV